MKSTRVLAASLFFLSVGSGLLFAADNILGLWRQMNDKGMPQSIASIYKYQDKIYARILAIYEKDGKTFKDSIAVKKEKAEKLVGAPATCGLDFAYGLEDKGKDYRGLIMDPESGDEYVCVIWKDGQKLMLRGQLKGLGFLGRNQTWYPASPADMPAGIAAPDPTTFVPVIPKSKK